MSSPSPRFVFSPLAARRLGSAAAPRGLQLRLRLRRRARAWVRRTTPAQPREPRTRTRMPGRTSRVRAPTALQRTTRRSGFRFRPVRPVGIEVGKDIDQAKELVFGHGRMTEAPCPDGALVNA